MSFNLDVRNLRTADGQLLGVRLIPEGSDTRKPLPSCSILRKEGCPRNFTLVYECDEQNHVLDYALVEAEPNSPLTEWYRDCTSEPEISAPEYVETYVDDDDDWDDDEEWEDE